MRVAIVGAGLSGLVAARRLADDHEVVLLDKGRSVGGRLATRRIGDAVLDHGAQFFTVRGDDFHAQVDDWLARDLVHVWCQGFGEGDGYPRYVGSAGMNSLAKDLAVGLDTRPGNLVFALRPTEDGWDVVIYPIEAYSTLGMFVDPIVTTMLERTESQLSDLIIHEATHNTIWRDDDVQYNVPGSTRLPDHHRQPARRVRGRCQRRCRDNLQPRGHHPQHCVQGHVLGDCDR